MRLLGEKLTVTVIATGFETGKTKEPARNTQTTAQNTVKTNPIQNPNHNKTRVSLDDDEDKPSQNGKKSYFLDDDDFKKKETRYSIEPIEPVRKEKETSKQNPPPAKDNSTQKSTESADERRERLKNLSVKLNSPEAVNELENKPAFLRKGIKLDELPKSSEPNLSRLTISDDEEPELRDNNSFLHDNVD